MAKRPVARGRGASQPKSVPKRAGPTPSKRKSRRSVARRSFAKRTSAKALRANGGTVPAAESYKHPESELLLRPDVGTQSQFKKRKPPVRYKYDSSLSPALDWDGQNKAREEGESLVKQILDAKSLDEAKAAAAKLKSISNPFLDWAGKAERLSFDVPTLPLFVHERLSTKAIIETLTGHRRPKETQSTLFDLFADPEYSITDQVLRAYEHRDRWTNRMILGDSLVVMNSLVHYENLGGQVQMIYVDPPYGVKYGSNFQPFVRKRDVKHGDDEDFTREPEMVQAYRDTWEVGLHSYLTCLRDRLLLSRELLHPSGSIFVQISDENLHHVREVMDEVFGAENFITVITFAKTSSATTQLIAGVCDYILQYARDKSRVRYRQILTPKVVDGAGGEAYQNIELPDGTRMSVSEAERQLIDLSRARFFRLSDMRSQRPPGDFPVDFGGRTFRPGRDYWKTGEDGFRQLITAKRIEVRGNTLNYVRYLNDFPAFPVTNIWPDVSSTVGGEKVYAVQTNPKVVERCLLMTTDPGDLVLDPTCGSGTTAYVAEQWGRRWITCDVSRVPMALARQRLLTATFPWYKLKDADRGPAGGFVYQRKQNRKGEEVGRIVPHVTLKSIANNEPPTEEVLVDRPERDESITRVTGAFCVEATIPTPMDWGDLASDGQRPASAESDSPHSAISASDTTFAERMLEILRKSPVLRLEGNRQVTLKNIRPPAKSLSLSAEALSINGEERPLAFVFGPENGAVSNRLVESAAREAHGKNYSQLLVIGFAIDAKARDTIANCEAVFGVPATYVQATPDLLMGDLLKNMRSSQIFSVCGLPEVKIHKAKEGKYQVELLGLDVFDPVTMQGNRI